MRASRVVLVLLTLTLMAGGASAQVERAFRNQWFWGAQTGLMLYQTNAQPYYFDPGIGIHWLITREKSGLFVSYEHYLLLVDARACVTTQGQSSPYCGAESREVRFDQVRRITFAALIFPSQGHLMPYAGLGFSLSQVVAPFFPNSEVFIDANEFNQAFQAVSDAATTPVGVLILGGQITVSKFHLFGQYTITTPGANFLLRGTTHNWMGGMRYSFGSSREDVTTKH
jgi:hypothetical protein